MTSGDRTPRRPPDFNEWPPSAQEAYRQMRRRVKRLKESREAVRASRDRLRLKPDGDGSAPAVSPAEAPPVGDLDDLTLPWRDFMDGRVHRLKHGRDFHGDVSAVIEEARLAARMTGRGLLQLREEMGPKLRYVWVQFADHAVLVGDPCPCGGRRLTRLHTSLARCERCGRTLTLTPR